MNAKFIFCCFFVCLTIISVSLFADEQVFDKKLDAGNEIKVIKRKVPWPQPTEEQRKRDRDENLRSLKELFPDFPKGVAPEDLGDRLYPQNAFEYVILRTSLDPAAEKKLTWRTRVISRMLFDDYETETKFLDVALEGEMAVVVVKEFGSVDVDIWPASKDSTMPTLFTGPKTNPKTAKIEGSLKEGTLAVIIELNDGSISRWHWDGKEWIEVKKSDQ